MCASSSPWWLAGSSDRGMAPVAEEGTSGTIGEGKGAGVAARAEEARGSKDW
jgi:hypothetical protein